MSYDGIHQFNQTLVDAIQKVFLKNFTACDEVAEFESPTFINKYMVSMDFKNDHFEGQAILGLTPEVVDYILEGHFPYQPDPSKEKELIHSALGELLNIASNLFVIKQPIKADHGQLDVSPPFIWDSEHDDEEACIVWKKGISGKIRNNGNHINTFFTVMPVSKNKFHISSYDTIEIDISELKN